MINYSIVIRGTKPGTKTEDITETKAYGVAQISENLTINDFAKHIAEHGTLYSRDVIQGVLIKMVDCMRERPLHILLPLFFWESSKFRKFVMENMNLRCYEEVLESVFAAFYGGARLACREGHLCCSQWE